MPYRDESSPLLAACPRCEALSLAPLASRRVRVLACKACGGVFVARDVMERLVSGDATELEELAAEATRAPPHASATKMDVPCPGCGAIMKRVYVADAAVHVDVCPAHGAWFNRWEGQQVAEIAKSDEGAALLRELLFAKG